MPIDVKDMRRLLALCTFRYNVAKCIFHANLTVTCEIYNVTKRLICFITYLQHLKDN